MRFAGDQGREALAAVAARAWHGFQRHRDIDSVASLSFFAALTLFPAALTALSAAALVTTHERAVSRVVELVRPVLRSTSDDEIRDVVNQLVHLDNPAVGLVIGIAFTLYAASSYATAFGRAVNNVYEVQEGRRLWSIRPRNVVVALLVVVAVAIAFALVISTPETTRYIADRAGIPVGFAVAADVVKWPLAVALALLALGTLYQATPNVLVERHAILSYGTALGLVGAGIGSAGFLVYVTAISDYSRAYGWLGAGLLAMWWLFIVNLAFMLGAEFDAEAVRVAQLRGGMPAETTLQVRLRSTERNLKLARGLAEDERRARELRTRAAREREEQAKHLDVAAAERLDPPAARVTRRG